MSRSVLELEICLSEHRAWRVKEISSVKKLASQNGRSVVETEFYCRAGVALFYSHWEGFVKRAAEEYLKYLSVQKIEFSKMADFLAENVLIDKINKKPARECSEEILKLFLTDQKSKPFIGYKNVIDTESNLSSRVFLKILKSVGISPERFETKLKIIDSILGNRNPIVHGAKGDVDVDKLISIGDFVIELTALFKEEIENSAQEKKYLRGLPDLG